MTNTSSRLQHQPKVLATYYKLLDIVKHLESNQKLPTAAALRTQLGVSLETLNHALRELEQQRLIYSLRGVGIYVSPRRRTCLLVAPSLFCGRGISPFWQFLVDSIRDHAASHNEEMIFRFAHPESFRGEFVPEDVQQQIEDGHLTGVIGVGIGLEVCNWLDEHTSLVGFATDCRCAVGLHPESIILQATNELVRQGCRDIAFWKPCQPFPNQIAQSVRNKEVELFTSVLYSQGLVFKPALTHPQTSPLFDTEAMTYQEQGYRTARVIFGKEVSEHPDGIFIGNDMMTVGVLEALGEMGIKVGEDVLIASHANKGTDVLPADAPITVFEYDPQEIAHDLFAMLDELLQGDVSSSRSLEIKAKMRTQVSPKIHLDEINV